MPTLLQLSAPVVDIAYEVAAIPTSGTEARVRGYATHIGGGYNAMAAMRAAGVDVDHAGPLGTGPLADSVRAVLKRSGIAHRGPTIADRDQGCCAVLIEPSGERSLVSAIGAEGIVRPGDLDGVPLDGIGWMLLSGYTLYYPSARDAVAEWIARCPASPSLIFDPSPMIASIPPDVLAPAMARAAWISANAAEAETMTGESDPGRAARRLAEGREGSIVRLGPDGCLLARDGRVTAVAGYAVVARDTTGAGDTHLGSFSAELALRGDPLRAAAYANVAAALSVTRRGSATPPERTTVEAILDGGALSAGQ